jgi:hypothetical protein
MNVLRTSLIAASTFWISPAIAHNGPEGFERHLAEHLLIALAVGLPVTLALFRWRKRSRQSSR